MNAKQAKVIETVTNKQWLEWKFCISIDGDLTVKTTSLGDKIFVHVSNVGCK